jgi:alanine dehydrogenase
MNIGIPKESRPFEFRVGLPPAGAEILCQQGHTIFVEHEAGVGAGFSDHEYQQAGASIVYSTHEVFGRADLLLKVTRPMQDEIEMLNPGATLMGLLHLASTKQDRIDALLKNKITSIAYEEIRMADGTLPVLRSLSQIGGIMTAQIAARIMQSNYGGKGILLGGVAGVPPAEVVIIGAGTSGTCAAKSFLGFGAHVTVLDKSMDPLQRIAERFPQVVTMISTRRNIDRVCSYADVVIGAVLIPGERSPIVLPRETIRAMKPRSLFIDLSIDQGGCAETSRPTTHDRPTYVEDGVIHYCVPNVPGVVARTATHAFVNAAMPYIRDVAALGVEEAMKQNPAIEVAVATHQGEMAHLHRWVTKLGGD